MADTITIRKPFDAHVHGRDGAILRTVGPMTARQFWGAIFEPNLVPPITTPEQGEAYIAEIERACASYPGFIPFVLAYLTDDLDPEALAAGLSRGIFIGAKFYPKGATTNSDSGIVDVSKLWERGSRQYDLIRVLTDHDKVCQLHCELNYTFDGEELDPYDKEAYFFKEVMPRLIDAHPNARFSCEHLTSKEGATFLFNHGGRNLGCSITPHHLLYDRRDMFRGGLRPHKFCLPVIKRSEHTEALRQLVLYGRHFVYAGTDSAPHDRRKKECDCCSGGVFTAHAAVEFYAEVFDQLDILDDRFEAFLSLNAPLFYGVSPTHHTITLERVPWTVDEVIPYSEDPEDVIIPDGFDKDPDRRLKLNWKLQGA